ncbi:GIY-YIG nuclease family protein [Paenibacillus sp. FSL R7-0204]|uniref:GIY-YIG nuclease family protein n=1 Tax=Paenibacillus sp. FSL R7-0204 TaxID=2921675 RepID=UPI0040468E5C
MYADGRSKLGHEGAKKGSFIYLLYDVNDNLLYVGETGTHLKNRLYRDGSGSHYITNRTMYDETKYVEYIRTEKEDALTPMERKMIEQALSIYLKPKYYNKIEWDYQ